MWDSRLVANQCKQNGMLQKEADHVVTWKMVEEEGDTWMTPIFEYLKDETLPADVKKVRAVRRKSQWFADLTARTQARDPLWKKPYGSIIMAICIKMQGHYKGVAHDCQGPFSEGPRKVKFLIVAMDYFTKWIEAKPVATITDNQIKKFVWDNIVYRFGLSGEIISDNGKQFRDNPFKDWCEKLCIRQHFASVKHPQTNGLVERANRSLGEEIKARLDAVIPAELGMPTLRTAKVDLAQNNEALGINLDLLEERR
ncbi:reverse transcriptase domain-containing protein [Tanacetum coccineum]